VKPILTIVLFSLSVLALAGCRAVPELSAPQPLETAQDSGEVPTITVESLDYSIPLGDSFPIVVKIDNAPPSQEISLDLNDYGIIPSLTSATVTADALGHTELRLSGRSTEPELVMLNVRAFLTGGTISNVLYVNFEPPPVGELQAQAADLDGEPVTVGEYFADLPVVTGLTGLEDYGADKPDALVVDNVQFPTEDGGLEEPIDLVAFNAGEQVGDGESVAQLSSCTRAWTKVYLKSYIDGSYQPVPASTRVYVSGNGYYADGRTQGATTKQMLATGSGGALEFYAGCDKKVFFQVLAWTHTGIYNHIRVFGGYKLVSWYKDVVAPSGSVTTATSLRGDTIAVSSSGSASNVKLAQRVFYKINKVYDWERKSHTLYSTFPLSIVYPDGNSVVNTSRAHHGMIYLESGDGDYDPTLFHEFGHEVYYRRMLGGDTYRRHHEIAVSGGGTHFPWCIGSVGWSIWSSADGCAGMLEGFALWFDSVATRAISGTIDRPFEAEDRPSVSGSNAGGAVPGRVAQFLWDITDAHAGSSGTVADEDADAVEDTRSSIDGRYAGVARYFYSAQDTTDFNYIIKYRILPNLPISQRADHCTVVRYNTLSVAGTCG